MNIRNIVTMPVASLLACCMAYAQNSTVVKAGAVSLPPHSVTFIMVE